MRTPIVFPSHPVFYSHPMIVFGPARFSDPMRFHNPDIFPTYYQMNFGYWPSITVWRPSLWQAVTWAAVDLSAELYWDRFDRNERIAEFQFQEDADHAAYYDHYYYSWILANPNVDFDPVARYDWVHHKLDEDIRKYSHSHGWKRNHLEHRINQLQTIMAQMQIEYPALVGTMPVLVVPSFTLSFGVDSALDSDDSAPVHQEDEGREEHRHRRAHKKTPTVHVTVDVE